jgi:phosphatidate cytidylyltransferase
MTMIKFSKKTSAELIKRTVTGIILAASFMACAFIASAWMISFIFLGILLLILLYEWPFFKIPWLTPFYPIGPVILLMALNLNPERILIPFLVITVGSYEAGAYCIGKIFGYYKLCPTISPGKTWEGVLGGYIVSILIAFWYTRDWKHATSLSIITCVTLLVLAATLGDLFESYLKRRVRLKDAGSLLPGHGGILDRIDGILGAVLILYPLRGWFVRMLGLH